MAPGRAFHAGGHLTAGRGGTAWAHTSDAYLQLSATPDHLDVRWDISLLDLDVALDLYSNADGKLTWGEIVRRGRASRPMPCRSWSFQAARSARALQRRADGAYAVLTLFSNCTLPPRPSLAYGLFADRRTAASRRSSDRVRHWNWWSSSRC